MSKLPFHVVDAFTNGPFTGNPAAVVPLDSWLDDGLLQAIAAQHNLSETAYFVRRAEPHAFDLRWFTPTKEVDLCGHATLAAASIVLEDMHPDWDHVRFHTRSGWLGVGREGDRYALDFPIRLAVPTEPMPGCLAALGGAPELVLKANYWLVIYPSEAAIRALAPDMGVLAALGVNACVTAPADEPGVDFASRFFAPASGIPEDPVTGSAHCMLAPYWAARLGKTTMVARQVSARGGWLEVALDGERVAIAGRTRRYASGVIFS